MPRFSGDWLKGWQRETEKPGNGRATKYAQEKWTASTKGDSSRGALFTGAWRLVSPMCGGTAEKVRRKRQQFRLFRSRRLKRGLADQRIDAYNCERPRLPSEADGAWRKEPPERIVGDAGISSSTSIGRTWTARINAMQKNRVKS